MGLYSVKYGTYDRQKAIGYIAYMIASSYFKETPKNRWVLTWRLDYAEMKENQKYENEAYADTLMERLGEKFLTAIGDLKCSLAARREGEDLRLYFFTGGFEALICTVDPRGRLEIKAVPAP